MAAPAGWGIRPLLLLLLLILPAPSAEAGGFLEEWRHEWRMLRFGLRTLSKPAPPPPAFRPGRRGKGRLTIRNGVPVLDLVGTPREMGWQHGSLLGPQIRFLHRRYLLPLLGGRRAREEAYRYARRLARHLRPEEREELWALGEASGIGYPDALLAAAFLDIVRAGACSLLHVEGGASGESESFCGRNLDFPGLGILDSLTILIRWHPRGGSRFVTIGWPGFPGAVTGMNESGLALALLLVEGAGTATTGPPCTILFRRLLSEAASVRQARAILEQSGITVGNNLYLADRSGRAGVAELSPGRIAWREPAGGRLVCTNHHLRRHRFRPTLTALSSRLRYRCLERGARTGPIDRDRMVRLLGRVAPPWSNIQSILLYPASRELYLACGTPPAARRPYRRFRAEELFGPEPDHARFR